MITDEAQKAYREQTGTEQPQIEGAAIQDGPREFRGSYFFTLVFA